jgi:hypothetical protein
MVPDDCAQPLGKAIGLFALAQALGRSHERVMTDVLGVGVIGGLGQCDRVRRAIISAHQCLERATVAVARPCDERGVRWIEQNGRAFGSTGLVCHAGYGNDSQGAPDVSAELIFRGLNDGS